MPPFSPAIPLRIYFSSSLYVRLYILTPTLMLIYFLHFVLHR